MSQLKNDRLLKTIRREPVDVTPIWVMRQAGRYLPEYRATRERAGSFMQLCKTPELACEVTLQPLARYAFDASIIFSDILTIPDAMGLGLHFVEGEGPRFTKTMDSQAAIDHLAVPDLAKLEYVYDAIRLVQHELAGRVPLIGFCGSPWTLAAYMIEGRAKTGFNKALTMLKKDPALLHRLLTVLAQSVCAHLNAQIAAGVNAVMIFDTWGGLLDTRSYQDFSLHYIKQVLAGLARQNHDKAVPVILFTKGGGRWLEEMAATGCDVLGLDWETSLQEARARVGNLVALQGNLDPACLRLSEADIEREVARVLQSYGTGSGHVFNLGHGITPDINPEKVGVLVEAVHELSKPYHKIVTTKQGVST